MTIDPIDVAEVLAENAALRARIEAAEERLRAVRAAGSDITGIKKTELALRQSEQRERERARELAALLEAIPTPVIIVHDPDARHMTGNRAADELVRLPRGAEVSMSAPEPLKPVHFKAVKDGRELRLDELPAQRAARGEAVRDFEFNLVFDDGTVRVLLAYGTPLLDDQGRPRGAVHTLVDITARKQLEQELETHRRHLEELVEERTAALRVSEQELKDANDRLEQRVAERTTALSASLKEVGDLRAALDEHAIVAITDSQGRITFVNHKFCAISQYSRAELLGQDHRLINSGHHPKEFMRDLWTMIAQGRPWHGEIKNRAKDGSFYWVDTTIMPILNESGKPRQYVAIRADITQRKQAEEQLRASEEFNRQTLQALPAHIAVIDHVGRIVSVNEAWLEFARHNTPPGTPILAVGTQYLEACRRACSRRPAAPERQRGEREEADPLSANPENASQRRSHETPPRGEADPSAADAESADAALTGIEAVLSGTAPLFSLEYPCHSPQEQRWFLMTVAPFGIGAERGAVITHLNITARKLAEAEIRRLNLGLEQRVSERTTQLEAANQELEAFSYSVSHDLRAPLRAVHGFVRILQEDYAKQLDAEGKRLLGVVRDEAIRMGRLIDDLLAFSRLGRQRAEQVNIDMTALARSEFEHQTMVATETAPRLDLKPLPPAHGDPAMLRQVFANFFGNAVKFSRHQPAPVIEVGGVSENGLNTYYVKDNGVGFDDRYAQRLFGVFQRLHTQSEFEGTGIGLALVQRIIHRHGGQVRAESKPGAGATFYFTLPAGPNL